MQHVRAFCRRFLQQRNHPTAAGSCRSFPLLEAFEDCSLHKTCNIEAAHIWPSLVLGEPSIWVVSLYPLETNPKNWGYPNKRHTHLSTPSGWFCGQPELLEASKCQDANQRHIHGRPGTQTMRYSPKATRGASLEDQSQKGCPAMVSVAKTMATGCDRDNSLSCHTQVGSLSNWVPEMKPWGVSLRELATCQNYLDREATWAKRFSFGFLSGMGTLNKSRRPKFGILNQGPLKTLASVWPIKWPSSFRLPQIHSFPTNMESDKRSL